MPEDIKAELIGGVVYVASPRRNPHGRHSRLLRTLFGNFEAATPGVEGADNVTVILGEESEPQPDLCLRLLPEFGGQSKEDEDQYLRGAPELIIEVAHSTAAIDLGGKLRDYRRGGLREYLVFCVTPGDLHTFVFPGDKKSVIAKGGIHRSSQFPGLWIDVGALAERNARTVLATGQAGLASDEHARFVERLEKRVKASRSARPGRQRKKK